MARVTEAAAANEMRPTGRPVPPRRGLWVPATVILSLCLAVLVTDRFLFPREPPPIPFLAGLIIALALTEAAIRSGRIPDPYAWIEDRYRAGRPIWALGVAVPALVMAVPWRAGAVGLVWLALLICFGLFLRWHSSGLLAPGRREPWSAAGSPRVRLTLACLAIVTMAAVVLYLTTPRLEDVRNKVQYSSFDLYLDAARTYLSDGVLFAVPFVVPYAGPGLIRFEERTTSADDVGYVVVQSFAGRLGLAPSPAGNLVINETIFLLAALALGGAASFILRTVTALPAVVVALVANHRPFAEYLYALTDQRGAAVGLGLLGLALVVALPIAVRALPIGALIWIGAGTGLAAGVFAAIRQSVGLSVLAAAVVTIALFGRRRGGLVVVVLAAAAIGSFGLVGASKDALFAYRDAAIGIRGDTPAAGAHVLWYSLLGGTGALCDTSIGMQWDDAVIVRALEQEQPGIIEKEMDTVARRVFLRYVWEHPREFAICAAYKAYALARIVLAEARWLWWPGLIALGLVASLLAIAESPWRRPPAPAGRDQARLAAALAAGLVFLALTALVPVLTNPLGFYRETVVVAFGWTLLAVGGLLIGLRLTVSQWVSRKWRGPAT